MQFTKEEFRAFASRINALVMELRTHKFNWGSAQLTRFAKETNERFDCCQGVACQLIADGQFENAPKLTAVYLPETTEGGGPSNGYALENGTAYTGTWPHDVAKYFGLSHATDEIANLNDDSKDGYVPVIMFLRSYARLYSQLAQ